MGNKFYLLAAAMAVVVFFSFGWAEKLPEFETAAFDNIQQPPPSICRSGGPDAYGYYFIDSADSAVNAPQYNWIEISGYGTEIPFDGDDQNFGPFLIGFMFNFYNVDFLTFRVCTNGFISFSSALPTYTNVAIPTADDPNDLVAAFWDDLSFYSSGDAYYYSNNTDTLIVEWKDVPFLNNSGIATFEAIITADTNILFQYYSITGTDDSHTIGIENQTGSVGLQYIYNSASSETGKAIRFSKTAPDYGAHDVLIVAADYGGSMYMADINAFPDIGTVDYFNARTATPTLDQLLQYDAVVTWSNYGYYDAAGLGNVLADYVDAGGGVVMHSFSAYQSYSLQGRFMDEYSPVGPGSSFTFRNMGTIDVGHPIMVGSDSLRDQFAVNLPTTNSPYIVGLYRDGVPAVVYNIEKPVVVVNGYVGDQNRQFSGDMIMISHNAINYAANGHGEVLFLMSDYGATYTKNNLDAYSDINGIEYYVARYATPSLAYLQNYSAVVVWSNSTFSDPTMIGNRLADYIDLGGAVVMSQFCFANGWAMQGRLMASYSPFGAGAIRYGYYTLGVHQPGNPLMAGVEEASDFYTAAVTMQNGGISVASWDDSTPFVAYHPGTNTVSINAYYGRDRAYDGDMIPLLHNAILVARGDVGVDELETGLPDKFALYQNYPNPFNPSTNIAFDLPQKSNVIISVYNILGQELTRLADREFEAGHHEVIFNADGWSSGVYFYKLQTASDSNTKKMVILK